MLGATMDIQPIMTIAGGLVGFLLGEFIKSLIKEVNQGPNRITPVGVIKLVIGIFQGLIAGAAIAFAVVYLLFSEPQSNPSGPPPGIVIRTLVGTGEYMPTKTGWGIIGCGAVLGSLLAFHEWDKKRKTPKQ
jgi:hypothetical protein